MNEYAKRFAKIYGVSEDVAMHVVENCGADFSEWSDRRIWAAIIDATETDLHVGQRSECGCYTFNLVQSGIHSVGSCPKRGEKVTA